MDCCTCLYILFRSLLDKEEVGMIMKCLTGSNGLAKEAFTVSILYIKMIPVFWSRQMLQFKRTKSDVLWDLEAMKDIVVFENNKQLPSVNEILHGITSYRGFLSSFLEGDSIIQSKNIYHIFWCVK